MVRIFPTSFFLLWSKFSLGKLDLVKILLFFGKILLMENSHIATDLRDNPPCPCWLLAYLLPITWKATPLMLSRTAWPYLAKGASELQSCQAQRRSAVGYPFFPLLWQQQGEQRGYCKILLPQDMQVLHELMQLKKPNRQTGVICSSGGG